ncbi:hypothetical protein ACFUCH_37345 [Streptomyces olivaceus]|uniref:hypothetical protein n=1 Tax=Streptomyces olivaceus TaxID=47716 RepID=UPI00363523CE
MTSMNGDYREDRTEAGPYMVRILVAGVVTMVHPCFRARAGAIPGAVRPSLSPATVTRLTQQWRAGHAAVVDRDFAEVDYVYGWADGIHLNVRLEEAKACVLVLVGV